MWKLTAKFPFGLCSKVRIEERGFLCEVSNSPGIALCPFEIIGGGA